MEISGFLNVHVLYLDVAANLNRHIHSEEGLQSQTPVLFITL